MYTFYIMYTSMHTYAKVQQIIHKLDTQCHGCALRLYMHISVHKHSAALFRKETLYRCCFISATCCQSVNMHSHSARLLLLFHADMFYEG